MTPSSVKINVIHPALLVGLFTACIGAALFLIPRDAELLHRLVAGGKGDRARELVAASGLGDEAEQLQRELAGDGAGESAVAEVVMSSVELLEITLDELPGGGITENEITHVAAVLGHCEGTGEEFAVLGAHADRFPDSAVEKLFAILARRALANSKPALAAEIFDALGERVADPGEDTVGCMVMAYRYSAQPARALEVMKCRFADAGELDGETRDTLVALYLENSDPAGAFELLKAEIDSTQDAARLAELMPRATQAASYAGHADQLAPLFERFLGEMPEGKMEMAELVAKGKSAPAIAESPFVHYSMRYAQICQWTDRYDTSFDYYAKAAALGHEPALEQCIKIYAGLYRHADIGKLLAALAPFKGEKAPQRTLLLAGLTGGSGDYKRAEEYFEEYLAENPRDVDALVSLAALRAESGNFESALATYQAALRERPDDIGLRSLTAEIHISLGHHDEAFELFRSIPESEHTEATIEQYLLLADSLANPEELNRAQRFAFNRKSEPSADDFLDLAESYALKGDRENELLILKGAFAAKPESQKLALTLADSYYRESLFAEAAEILIRPDLLENPRALAIFIEICGGNDQFEFAVRHLPAGVEDRHHFSPSIRIELGQIYEETGNYDAAAQLYASVPEGGQAWQLLASAQYRKGDLDRAEEYQMKYLRAAVRPDAQDWIFMGDIYKSLGKVDLADEAYRRSLTMMKSQL